MNRVIHKFPISITSEFTLAMPMGFFEPLSVQMQRGVPVLWAKVYKGDVRMEPVLFRLIATGEEFEDNPRMRYIATFQLGNGLVFHLHEVKSS